MGLTPTAQGRIDELDEARLAGAAGQETDRLRQRSGGSFFVHRPIGEGIGFPVSLAGNVFQLDAAQTRDHPAGRGVEDAQAGILDAVPSFHLPDEEFGVGSDPQGAGVERSGVLEQREKGGVLRDVVGGDSEVAIQFDRIAARHVINPDAISRWAGIASRSAIDVGDE